MTTIVVFRSHHVRIGTIVSKQSQYDARHAVVKHKREHGKESARPFSSDCALLGIASRSLQCGKINIRSALLATKYLDVRFHIVIPTKKNKKLNSTLGWLLNLLSHPCRKCAVIAPSWGLLLWQRNGGWDIQITIHKTIKWLKFTLRSDPWKTVK